MSITPSTKIKVGLPTLQIKYLAKSTEMSFDEILGMINDMLMYVLDELIRELEIWIKSKVPKRTGQLRDSLIANLHSSRVKLGLMRIILGTNLDYAEDVNEMSTRIVRHSGEPAYAYYYGHYGKITLNDPQAIGGFFDALLKFAKERTMFILQRAIDEYFKGTGKLMRMVRGRL